MKSLLRYDKVMMAELGLLSVCDHNPWQKQLKAGKIYFGPWYQRLSVLCVQESTEKSSLTLPEACISYDKPKSKGKTRTRSQWWPWEAHPYPHYFQELGTTPKGYIASQSTYSKYEPFQVQIIAIALKN